MFAKINDSFRRIGDILLAGVKVILVLASLAVLACCFLGLGLQEKLPEKVRGATYTGNVLASTPRTTLPMPVSRTVRFDREKNLIYLDGNPLTCSVSGKEVVVDGSGNGVYLMITFTDEEYTTLKFVFGGKNYAEEGVLRRSVNFMEFLK